MCGQKIFGDVVDVLSESVRKQKGGRELQKAQGDLKSVQEENASLLKMKNKVRQAVDQVQSKCIE